MIDYENIFTIDDLKIIEEYIFTNYLVVSHNYILTETVNCFQFKIKSGSDLQVILLNNKISIIYFTNIPFNSNFKTIKSNMIDYKKDVDYAIKQIEESLHE